MKQQQETAPIEENLIEKNSGQTENSIITTPNPENQILNQEKTQESFSQKAKLLWTWKFILLLVIATTRVFGVTFNYMLFKSEGRARGLGD